MKKLLKKRQAWVAIVGGLLTIVVAILTITGAIFDLPGKIRNSFKKKESSLVLSGVIWDGERNPLSGVTVRLRESGLTDTTNQDGEFRFQIKATEPKLLHLVAQKDGYENYNTDVKWENTKLEFTMRRKELREKKEQTETKLLQKWQTWVGIIAGLLAIAGVILKLLGKIGSAFKGKGPEGSTQQEPTELVQILSGIIRGEGNEPLVGATVTLAEFDLTTTTNQYGKYEFQVTARKQQTVNLIAQKAGYETYNTYTTLGTVHSFTMEGES